MVPNVASMTTAAIDSRTIPLFIAAVRVLVEQRDCISAAFLSRDTTSEISLKRRSRQARTNVCSTADN